jgi:hypothetical protein
MEWADVARLYRYWNESPPVHELVAAWIGYKPPTPSAPVGAPAVDFGALKELIKGGRLVQAVGA